MMYCDMHSHSRQKGCFLYGCMPDDNGPDGNKKKRKKKSDGKEKLKINDPRLFSYLLTRRCSMFSYKKCDFRLSKGKECTARAVVCKELNVRNGYTMELSFCGGDRQNEHFSMADLLSVGAGYANTLIDLYSLHDEVKLV